MGFYLELLSHCCLCCWSWVLWGLSWFCWWSGPEQDCPGLPETACWSSPESRFRFQTSSDLVAGYPWGLAHCPRSNPVHFKWNSEDVTHWTDKNENIDFFMVIKISKSSTDLKWLLHLMSATESLLLHLHSKDKDHISYFGIIFVILTERLWKQGETTS